MFLKAENPLGHIVDLIIEHGYPEQILLYPEDFWTLWRKIAPEFHVGIDCLKIRGCNVMPKYPDKRTVVLDLTKEG